MKGAVERFFRTMAEDLIHRLPGTTFSNTRERGDYPSEKLACLTLTDLESAVMKWIVDRYLQKPHRGLGGLTPAKAWVQGEVERPPLLPLDLDELECVLSHRADVRLHHYGVEVDRQQYHSAELSELRLRLGKEARVDVRFRDELGHVWVRDPGRNLFLQVPNKDSRMVGMSRDIYSAARQRARELSGNSSNPDAVFEAYRQIMADVEVAKRSNKLRKRRYAAQMELDKDGHQRECKPAAEESLPAAQSTLFDLEPPPPTLEIRPRTLPAIPGDQS